MLYGSTVDSFFALTTPRAKSDGPVTAMLRDRSDAVFDTADLRALRIVDVAPNPSDFTLYGD